MDDYKFRGVFQTLISLPPGVLKTIISVPPDLLEKPQVLSPDLLEKPQVLSPGVLQELQSLPLDVLQTLISLPPDVLQTLISLPPGVLQKLQSLPLDVLQTLISLPPEQKKSLIFDVLADVVPTLRPEQKKSLIFDVLAGKARETNLVERIMELEEHLKRVEEELFDLQEELAQEKFKSAQLEQKITEQDIKLKESRRLPRYEMSSCPRGICVIINNINFRGMSKRVGAELDEKELVHLYTELQFEVHRFRDRQWDQMRKVAVDFAKKDHSQFDAFVFIVMSHGGDKDVIYGVGGRHTRVEDLMLEFKAANCPTLQNKPKLFIIQTCRGSSDESLSPASCDSDTAAVFSPDSTLARSVCPQEADFLLSFATAPGYKAWRHPRFGSPYIQFLVEEIMKHHHSHHLLDILTEVNRRVVEEGIREGKAIQCPAPTHTLQGQVFL